jgi:hypothetical protein
MFQVAAGGFYHFLYATEVYGGEGLVAMGSTGNRASWDLNFQYADGETLHGLRVQKWRLGWTWDWIFDRFRFGLRPSFGVINLERATTGGYIGTAFIGFDAHASYDLVEVSHLSAFFISPAFKMDGGAWGPVIQIGFRGDMVTSTRDPASAKPRR